MTTNQIRQKLEQVRAKLQERSANLKAVVGSVEDRGRTLSTDWVLENLITLNENVKELATLVSAHIGGSRELAHPPEGSNPLQITPER
jgi:hypothetical protein